MPDEIAPHSPKAGNAGEAKIVVRRSREHRSGVRRDFAWQVAWADFCTALLCFFVVLWLISMSDDARERIRSYFTGDSAPAPSAGTSFEATRFVAPSRGAGYPLCDSPDIRVDAAPPAGRDCVERLR